MFYDFCILKCDSFVSYLTTIREIAILVIVISELQQYNINWYLYASGRMQAP